MLTICAISLAHRPRRELAAAGEGLQADRVPEGGREALVRTARLGGAHEHKPRGAAGAPHARRRREARRAQSRRL